MSSIHLLMNKHPFNLRCSRQLHKIVKVNISLNAAILVCCNSFDHVGPIPARIIELACQYHGVGLPPPYPQKRFYMHNLSVCALVTSSITDAENFTVMCTYLLKHGFRLNLITYCIRIFHRCVFFD